MRRLLAALVAVVALPLASCSSGDGDDDTYLLRLEGRAQVDGSERLRSGDHRLKPGQVVRITAGSARFGLPGDRTLELRSGDGTFRDSRLEVADVPKLVDGHALLVAGDDETLRLRAGAATIDLHGGAARVRRGTGMNLAVYEGSADVEALGQEMGDPVPALRQVAVADTGALPLQPSPLVYDRDELDPWDRRYLGPAIDLGGQLDRASLALNSELTPPTTGPDADYIQSLVPQLRSQPGVGKNLLERPGSSIGETMVGASIALGGSGPFVDRWSSVFDFREQGADWGLVALDQQARREAVLGVLDGILDAVAATLPTFAASVTPGGGGSAGPRAPPGPPAPSPTPAPGPEPDEPSTPGEPSPDSPDDPPPLITLPPLLGEPESESEEPAPTGPDDDGGLLGPVTDPVIEGLDGVVDSVDGLLGPVTDPLLG